MRVTITNRVTNGICETKLSYVKINNKEKGM